MLLNNDFIIKETTLRIKKNKKQIAFFQTRIKYFEKNKNLQMVVRYQKVIEKLNESNFILQFSLDELIKTTNQQNYCLIEENNNVIIQQPSINMWNDKVYKACEENNESKNINLKCMPNYCLIS